MHIMQLVKTALLLCLFHTASLVKAQDFAEEFFQTEHNEHLLGQTSRDPPLFDSLMIFTGMQSLLLQELGGLLPKKLRRLKDL